MALRVVITPPARLAANITPKLAKKYAAKLNDETGPLAKELAEKYAAEAYVNDRPAFRRRSNLHYAKNFWFKVAPASGGRGLNRLPSLQFRNRAKHAHILEGGSQGHTIRPHRKYLQFRYGTREANAYGVGGKRYRGGPVQHPGTTGTHIGRRATTTALRRTFRR
jgi:hypothetical protein